MKSRIWQNHTQILEVENSNSVSGFNGANHKNSFTEWSTTVIIAVKRLKLFSVSFLFILVKGSKNLSFTN
jgi:hypothetical protein